MCFGSRENGIMNKMLSGSLFILSFWLFTACSASDVETDNQSSTNTTAITDAHTDETTSENAFKTTSIVEIPAPFDENTDTDENSGFYYPGNRVIDNIPVELIRLVDGNDFNDWIDSFDSDLSSIDSFDDYANLYSFLFRFDITAEKAEEALSYYLATDDEQISISANEIELLLSGDLERVSDYFSNEYTISVGDRVYTENWVYSHSSDDYANAGIKKEDLLEKIRLYGDFHLTEQACEYFSEKLSVELNQEIAISSTFDGDQTKAADGLIIDVAEEEIEQDNEDVVEIEEN